MTFQLGYIRGWIPWLSEALSWIQTAGLYLQSHLQALEALAALQRQTLKSEELSTLAARAELDAMRAQIRPHFLFNTLNSIHSFIRDDPEQAEQVVEFLADLMRGVLQSSESDLIPLEQEIQLTETYLRIEKARYGNRLSFQIDFDPENDRIDVPPFSIQPLVENAIKHGVDAQLAPVDVQLTVRRDGEYVVIEVTDDGPGLADPPAGDSRPDYSRPDAAKGTGIALQNIRERLSRLYDEGASLELVIRQPHGTCARLKIPNAVSKAVND